MVEEARKWRRGGGDLPVDGDHADHAEVPDEEGEGDVVHGEVVRLQHLGQVEVGEEEEEHQARHEQPAVDQLRAPAGASLDLFK